jgi:hypothetical protein
MLFEQHRYTLVRDARYNTFALCYYPWALLLAREGAWPPTPLGVPNTLSLSCIYLSRAWGNV